MQIVKIDKKKRKTRLLLLYALVAIALTIFFIPSEIIKDPSIIGETIGIVRILGTNAPYFDPSLTNFTVNQTDPFFFDINCTEIDPIDPTTYTTNLTALNLSNSTGIINKSSGFDQSEVGNFSAVQFVCYDTFGFNDTEIIAFNILDVNEPPVLGAIGNLLLTEGEAFSLQLTATDPDGDNLTFNATTSLFSINTSSGFFNFTPSLSQIGNHTVNFTVFDGQLYDHEVVLITIVRGPFCGDSFCGSSETCETCSLDCGACPAEESDQSGAGAEGGDTSQTGTGSSTTSTSTGTATATGDSSAPLYRCEEKWECGEWGICSIEGIRVRQCSDINRCNTDFERPPVAEQCDYQPTCFDGLQNGGETGVDCGGNCEPCIIASCFDGIQNQGETGIDCGGPCRSCEEKEFTKAPFLEIPGIITIPRLFPWILLLLIALLLTATITWDQLYIRKLRKLKFEEYREEIRKYRPFRRKLYKFVLNTSSITLIVTFYIFIFSNNLKNMVYFSFIPILIICALPFGISYLIRYMEYYEYQKIKKEQHLKRTHIREILQLIKIENEVLYELEQKLKSKIFFLAKNHKFDENPDVYYKVNEIYGDISVLKKKRETRMELLKLSSAILDKIIAILESKNLERAVKSFPEYLSIKKELQYIEDNKDKDTTNEEDELLSDIEELSMPFMKTVNSSNKGLTALYNALVDLHEHYLANHDALRIKDNEIIQVERNFSDKVKALSKKAPVVSKIQENNEYARIYNGMIDLFNHYMKKHSLSKALENV